MAYKINLSAKDGKTYKLEAEAESLPGKKIGDKIKGEEINSDLSGYELEITGTSDDAGFAGMKEIEGQGLKKVLLKKGFGLKKGPRKEGKGKPRRMVKGLRKKKTYRGNTISEKTSQINTKIIKEGSKKAEEIFKKQEEKTEESKEQEPKKQEEKAPEKQEEKQPEKKEEKKE